MAMSMDQQQHADASRYAEETKIVGAKRLQMAQNDISEDPNPTEISRTIGRAKRLRSEITYYGSTSSIR